MRLTLIILFITIVMSAKSQEYCNYITVIQDYQESVKLERLEGDGWLHTVDSNTFNIHTYLAFFEKLTIVDGYKIGMFYYDIEMAGSPLLYAQKENENIINHNDNDITYDYLKDFRAQNFLIPKDSDIGFLQYLFFSIMGEQFALKWHSNYNKTRIICSLKNLDDVIDKLQTSSFFSADSLALSSLKSISPDITIERNNEFYFISWLENITHYGIYRCTYQIERKKPYNIIRIDDTLLLKIDKNIVY